MLDKAKTRVETEFQEDRLLQGKLLAAIGETYTGLGLVSEAAELNKKVYDIARETLGPEHPDTLSSMGHLAGCYWRLSRLDKSIPLFEETLRLYRRVYGENDPRTLGAMASLGRNYVDDGRIGQRDPVA